MGCPHNATIEKPEQAIDVKPSDVFTLPTNAADGQMDFFNVGSTTIYLRFSQTAGGNQVGSTLYSVKLLAGASYTHIALIPGTVIAVSSATGGLLTSFAAWRSL